MNQQEIETKVKQIIHEQADISRDEIKLESTLEDLDLDSLGQVELLLSLEEVFEIDIPDEDAEPLKTVQEIVDYIVKRLS